MREKFTGAIEIAEAVDVAEDLAQQGRPFEAEQYLLARLVRHPLSPGASEALLALGQIYRMRRHWHMVEVCALVSHRLRATALELTTAPRSLALLTLACAHQGSPDEVRRYARELAALSSDDAEALSMMERTRALEEANPAGDGESDEEGAPGPSELLRRATELAVIHPRKLPRLLHKLCRDLSRARPAPGLFRSWRMVAEVHVGTTPTDPNKGFQMLYQTAMATAAAGKAILVNPEAADRDSDLWFWYGSGLAQLSFYPAAIEALEQSYRVAASDRTRQTLDYARTMALQPEESPYRPDSTITWQAMREDAMARRAFGAPPSPDLGREESFPGTPWWSVPVAFIIGGSLGYTRLAAVPEPYNALLGAALGGLLLTPLFCKLRRALEKWKGEKKRTGR